MKSEAGRPEAPGEPWAAAWSRASRGAGLPPAPPCPPQERARPLGRESGAAGRGSRWGLQVARAGNKGRGQGASLWSHRLPWHSGLVLRAGTGLPERSGERERARPASARLGQELPEGLRRSWPLSALFSQGRQSWGRGANRPSGLEKVSDLPSPVKGTGLPPASVPEGLCEPDPAETADQRSSGRGASRHPPHPRPRGLGGSPGVCASHLKASVFLPFLPASSWTKRGILRSQVCKSPPPLPLTSSWPWYTGHQPRAQAFCHQRVHMHPRGRSSFCVCLSY